MSRKVFNSEGKLLWDYGPRPERPLPAIWRDEMSEMIERVIRALMKVRAHLPGRPSGPDYPVLALDPDYDDLPRDSSEGTEDDEITQEAVLRLSRAALEAIKVPTEEMLDKGYDTLADHIDHNPTYPMVKAVWTSMIEEALR